MNEFVSIQIDSYKLNQGKYAPKINEKIARYAWKEYDDSGYDQSFDRLHERGGFGIGEILTLLMDRIDRLEGSKGYGEHYGNLQCFEKDGECLDL